MASDVFFIFYLFMLLFAAALAQVDKTLEDGATGTDVVIATVNKIQESKEFPDDYLFLRRMARVESNDGETTTIGGIWNIDPASLWRKLPRFFDVSADAPKLQMKVQSAFGITWNSTFPTLQELNKPLYSALAVILYIQALKETIQDDVFGQADLWQRLFNTKSTTLTRTHFIMAATAVQQELACEIKKVDMVFVMDVSGSITERNYERMKQMAIDMTSDFEIGPDKTQVGWINFNEDAWVVFDLTTYHTKSSLHQAIRNIVYADGLTDIGGALIELYNKGFTTARSPLDVPHVGIVVTDGVSNLLDIQQAAMLIHDQRRIDMYAVGIEGYEENQLQAIAEAGTAIDPSRNVFTLPDFQTEGLQQLQEAIKARACFNSRFIKATIEELQGHSSTVSGGVTSYVNTDCPPKGLTVNVCGKEGKVIIYISKTTPTPNSANYDEKIEVNKDECGNTFINCTTKEETGRRKRQAEFLERIFIGIEGVEETNEYEVNTTTGDTSTPKVKLQCQQAVLLEPQSVIVTCTSERELTSILCSINNGPFQNCSFPWVVEVVSFGARNYNLRINVTDSLDLTDSFVIDYTVKPLILECWLSDDTNVECQSNNQLDLQKLKCKLQGVSTPCELPYHVKLEGFPAGIYEVQIQATDVFGFTDQSTVEYQLVEDRVSDDMVMSVPLDTSPSELGLTGNTLSLCYQIHGRAGKYFNLLSDQCVSVNAHVIQPHSDIDSNVMDQIGVHAVGNNGTCYNILMNRHNCSVHINGQQLPENTGFQDEDIVIRQYAGSIGQPQSVQISVPNCDGGSIDMFISCTYYNIQNMDTEILQFGSTRGGALAEPPHGLIGQFWGVFLTIRPYTGPHGRLSPTSDPYVVSIIHPDDPKEREFVATLVPRIWGSRQTPCLYAGDKQGGRTGSIIGGPRGTVIQGKYMDYEVEGLFHTQFTYSKFDETKC